jgi:uncharacterized protein (DUF305 family)
MNKLILYIVVGFVIGAVFSYMVFANKTTSTASQTQVTPTMTMENDSMTMDEMVGMLKGKTGDEFDKAFISGMIEHHQGAIDMAKDAQANAKHKEIKQMADEIIAAQTKEIELMKTWEKEWGYSETHH